MAHGTHDYEDDPRNADIQININGELFHRDKAMVSVFDSGYILGDGVWDDGWRTHCKLRVAAVSCTSLPSPSQETERPRRN